MYDRLLFPTDGSEGATAALEHVLDIAVAHDATLHLLNVADTNRESLVQLGGDVVDVLEREGEGVVREAAERAEARDVATVTEVLQGDPHSTIVDYATSRGIDLIVMPTQGRRGIERFLLGSTTERVVRESEVPVLTLRPDGEPPAYPYRNVLVATDGSDGSRAALEAGVDVANGTGATLHVLSVVDTASLGVDVRTDIQTDAMRESAAEIVEEASAFATDAGIESVTGAVEEGTAVHRAIRSYAADHDVDLVVVGTHGRSGLDRYVLGSVAERLVRTAPVPVMTVREPAEET